MSELFFGNMGNGTTVYRKPLDSEEWLCHISECRRLLKVRGSMTKDEILEVENYLDDIYYTYDQLKQAVAEIKTENRLWDFQSDREALDMAIKMGFLPKVCSINSFEPIDPAVLIKKNPMTYKLELVDAIRSKYAEPNARQIEVATRDSDTLLTIQKAIASRTKIAPGDYVQMRDGSYQRVTICWPTLQGGALVDHRVYLYSNGNSDYSGACGDMIGLRDNLEDTGMMRIGYGWIFSNNDVKADNSVEAKIYFKVWKFKQ